MSTKFSDFRFEFSYTGKKLLVLVDYRRTMSLTPSGKALTTSGVSSGSSMPALFYPESELRPNSVNAYVLAFDSGVPHEPFARPEVSFR